MLCSMVTVTFTASQSRGNAPSPASVRTTLLKLLPCGDCNDHVSGRVQNYHQAIFDYAHFTRWHVCRIQTDCLKSLTAQEFHVFPRLKNNIWKAMYLLYCRSPQGCKESFLKSLLKRKMKLNIRIIRLLCFMLSWSKEQQGTAVAQSSKHQSLIHDPNYSFTMSIRYLSWFVGVFR